MEPKISGKGQKKTKSSTNSEVESVWEEKTAAKVS